MKLRLTVDTGTLAGKSFELQSGFLTIGRGENCSIRFDHKSERIASKQHAFVEARSDGFYLTDNKSLNGTLLNGKAIDRAQLTSGDKIQFGRNGATASVTIQSEQVRAPDLAAAQFEHFEHAAALDQNDNLQKSMANIGLGQLEAVPEPSRTGR